MRTFGLPPGEGNLFSCDKYPTSQNQKGREIYNTITKYYASIMPLFFRKYETKTQQGRWIGDVTIVTSSISRPKSTYHESNLTVE